MTDKLHEGGCACGSVRYRLLSDPQEAGWCHCWTCQRMSGSGGIVWGTVPEHDFAYTRGAERVSSFQVSRHAVRSFASCCGSPLAVMYDFQRGAVDITIGCLDNPNIAPPLHHMFRASAPNWLNCDDELPCYEAFRPSTPGLKGTALPR